MAEQETKKCPYCGEEILSVARKCKYCGEWIEQKPAEKKVSAAEKTPVNDKDEDLSFKFDADDAKGCLESILTWVVIIGLLVWAYKGKPSEEKMVASVLENVRECVADKTSSALGFLSDDDDNTLGELASMFISNSSDAKETIDQSFYQNNEIRYNEHWFYTTAEIVNADHPGGTTVAFGVCGFVIPFVDWDDFKLINY